MVDISFHRSISRFTQIGAAFACAVGLVVSTSLSAQARSSIAGAIVDPLGARVADATVTLTRDGRRIAETSSDAQGRFLFADVDAGRYQIIASAPGFDPRQTDPFYVASTDRLVIDVALQIGLKQEVVVSAAATELPESQVGAQVTVIDSEALKNLSKLDVLEAIRAAPGVQVVQTGARGGLTSLFVRGGNSNFNKVLLDGVAANDIGGGVDLGQFATTGVDRVEVLRESNSVLYGSDALTGVISLTTRRGRTRIPELSASFDGGNFGSLRHDVSLGGAVKRIDYFSEFSHFDTDNAVPNNAFRNNTVAGRFGVVVGRSTDVSGTVRRVSTKYGVPNAFSLYGIADDSWQTTDLTFASVNADAQITDRWRNTIRFGWMDRKYHNVNPSPTGQLSGGNYLGEAVMVQGANGYTVSGRAILDFAGTYPSPFDTATTRRTLLGQTSLHVSSRLDLAGGVRVEHEEGSTQSTARLATDRSNGGTFIDARVNMTRVFINGGLGFDHNAIFGFAATPRVSIAAYPRNPLSTAGLGDTKLTFNAGRGIKAPNIAQELSSLFSLLQPVAGGAMSAASGISPIGPERSRSVDVGIEQGLWHRRARLRATYFDNTFDDLIEFVSKTVLPQVGVPPGVAAALPTGAYVNSQSFRARGLEASAEAQIAPHVRLTASLTHLDAVVTQSFASGALRPAINPSFPTIRIGVFSPLVGARPFRRPANSGTVIGTYADGPVQITVAASLVGKADDSTFLSDASFGNSLLLPNRDLDAGYQKVDLSAWYKLHPRLRWYLSLENVSNRRYEAVFGFPALPRAVRTGVTLTIGGDPSPQP